MTTVYSPISQCYGKVRYANKKEAKSAIKQVEARWGRRLNAYHCPHYQYEDNHYHIGNRVTAHDDTTQWCDDEQGEAG